METVVKSRRALSSRFGAILTSFARDCACINLGYDPTAMQVIAVSRRERRIEILG
jgi:hypothetical protein